MRILGFYTTISVLFLIGYLQSLESQNNDSLSLWKDTNPYSASQSIQIGDILTIHFREGLKVEYEAEYKADSDHKIMANPDKKMIPEMKGYESDQSIARRSNAKSKTNGKISGTMAVRVVGFDTVSDVVEIEGRREIRFDNDRQSLSIRGVVSRKDIDSSRSIAYNKIANLEIQYIGHPIPRIIQNPEIGLKTIRNPDGSTSVSSELSDTEKQEILLRYIKRLLGESGDEGAR